MVKVAGIRTPGLREFKHYRIDIALPGECGNPFGAVFQEADRFQVQTVTGIFQQFKIGRNSGSGDGKLHRNAAFYPGLEGQGGVAKIPLDIVIQSGESPPPEQAF